MTHTLAVQRMQRKCIPGSSLLLGAAEGMVRPPARGPATELLVLSYVCSSLRFKLGELSTRLRTVLSSSSESSSSAAPLAAGTPPPEASTQCLFVPSLVFSFLFALFWPSTLMLRCPGRKGSWFQHAHTAGRPLLQPVVLAFITICAHCHAAEAMSSQNMLSICRAHS